MGKDKTAHIHLEQDNAVLRKRLNEIEELASIGYWEWDLLSQKITWSDQVYKIFGVSKKISEIKVGQFEKMIHPDDLYYFLSERTKALSGDSNVNIIYRVIRPDGEIGIVQEKASIIRNNGNPELILGTVQDITESEKVKNLLSESYLLNLQLFNSVDAGIVIIDPHTKIIEKVNNTATALIGAKENAIIGQKCNHFLCPANENNCPITDLDQKIDHYETLLMKSDGTSLSILKSVKKVYIGDQEKILETFIDNRKEIEAQELFKQSNQELLIAKERAEKNEQIYREQKEEIEFSNERLESLLRISQFSTNKIQELLDFALEEAIKLTNSKIGYIYFYNENTRQFTLNTWSKDVMKECQVANPQTVYDLDKTGIWGEAVRQRKPIVLNDFQSDNPLKKGVPEGHVKLLKFLTIPVIFDNEIVAVAGVANKTTDYNNSDIRQLTLLLDNVWKISERIRLIEELKKAKEKAEENELLLNLILEHSPVLFFIKDENIRSIRLSKNFEQLLGLPLEQMIGKSNNELFPTDFAKKMDADDRLILQANKTTEVEEKYNDKFYTSIKFPVQMEGKPRYLAGYSIDITDRKHAEQALKDSEERWKFALEGARDGLWDWNMETNEVYFSTQWKAMLGFAEEEISNNLEEWSKRLHPDDLQKCNADIQLHLEGKEPFYSNVHRVLCKDGTYKWILDRGKIVQYNEAGKPVRMIGTHTDLTDRVNMEEALKNSEARSKAILQSMPDMMIVHNVEGTILDVYLPVNSTEYNSPLIDIGQKLENILPKELLKQVIPLINKAISTNEMQFLEFSYSRPDGEYFYESRTISFGPDKILSIIRDITERHLAEQIIKQQNCELTNLNKDKDRFVSILAHDLKDPFTTILGFLELLTQNIHKYSIDEIEAHVKIIDDSANRTYNLLIDILQWAKSQMGQLNFEPEDLILANICKLVIDSLSDQVRKKKVVIKCSVQDDISLYADPNMLKTIIRNLVSNAIKFSYENGKINIYTEMDNSNVVTVISDNGVGMSEENMEKLWDKSQPFTTKGTEKESGTGFGLILCQEFVKKHGGKIWVESKVGVGSKFKFTLPYFKSKC
jgi:PAS domain S-box-containing protein